MFKKSKVVLLSTNQKESLIWSNSLLNKLSYGELSPANCTHYHLYFLSTDEEIKENDWCYDLIGSRILINQFHSNVPNNRKKIIATTDKSLKIPTSIGSHGTVMFSNLPQPSQSFIEKYVTEYNKGNVIIEVLVEYELDYEKHRDNPGWHNQNLKVNSKDNTITIKKVKDSWTREEILKALNNPYGQGSVSRDEYRARVMSELDLD